MREKGGHAGGGERLDGGCVQNRICTTHHREPCVYPANHNRFPDWRDFELAEAHPLYSPIDKPPKVWLVAQTPYFQLGSVFMWCI